MPKAAAHSSEPHSTSARPRKSHGQDKPVFICGLDNCQWSSTDQSVVSRHKWVHLPKDMHPRCDALDQYGNRCGRRYSRLDDYRTHWNKAHKSQQWVNPQARQRFRCIWQEYCEQRNKCQFSITPSPFLDQAPGLAFPQASSMNITPPSASLPTAVDTLAMPMHLAQAPAQMAPVENDLGLFGQDLFASAAPFSDAKLPFLVLPPSAYNYPPAPFSFPSAFDHAQYSGYTPIDTTLCSRSSSVSASSASTPPAEGIFASDGASYQLHTSLEPFEDLNAGLRPSQADCHMWLADF